MNPRMNIVKGMKIVKGRKKKKNTRKQRKGMMVTLVWDRVKKQVNNNNIFYCSIIPVGA